MNCILCKNTTTKTKTIQIFGCSGKSLNIPEIISKHFWFITVDESSDIHKEICVDCWQQALSFNQFYERVRDVHLSDSIQPVKSPTLSARRESVPGEQFSEPCESKAITKGHRRKKVDSITPAIRSSVSNASTGRKKKVKSSGSKVDLESRNDDTLFVVDNFVDCNYSGDSNDDRDDDTDTETNRDENRDEKSDESVDMKLADYFRMNCDLCSEDLKSMADIQQHFKNKHNINRGYLRCNDCGKRKFKMRKSIIDHVTWHCDPNAFKCFKCLKTFGEETRLVFHKMTHHLDDEKLIFKCELCEKRFSKKHMLAEHVRRVHPPDDQIFKCDICPKEYKTTKLLHNHKQTVHNPKDVKHICDICARVLSSKHTLKEHIKTHTDDGERFECDECGAKLKSQLILIKHKKMHTDVEQTCGICFKVKPTQLALKTHMRNVHGEAKYKCTHCDKAFRRLLSLKEHVATHTGEVLYSCSFCTTTFKSNSNKFKHYKQVHFEQWKASKEMKK